MSSNATVCAPALAPDPTIKPWPYDPAAAEAALARRPLEHWREVFLRANASAFCRGEDGGWRAVLHLPLEQHGR